MKRRYDMPFGARIGSDGQVRFRLWAPGAKTVELVLNDSDTMQVLPMPTLEAGWFELTTDQARAGSRYRFRIDGDLQVPDPASRYNPDDVHQASQVIDPETFDWQDDDESQAGVWRGRPWEETVLYEIHVGAFSSEGTFKAVEERLDYLADLGVTAIELMPVADFPGQRNWGYDGVLLFAPDASYGTPEALKSLVQSAHARGLMVFLDVVYNHFGPDGNYLHAYAQEAFFTERHHTPWGAGINFDGPNSRPVRDFFIHNACYWLQEYHLDGLRFDAVHAILDDSETDIVTEIAEAVREGPGRERHIHLVLENDANIAHYLSQDQTGRPRWHRAQWNDDIHHALHVAVTGECDGYYIDYADRPAWYAGRCLTEGFAYQGERSPYRDGEIRGEPSVHLPPTAFVNFLQNHDQVGNRAFGERIGMLASADALHCAIAILLIAPSPPLLFMGEEFASTRPFTFFCDFGPTLATAVTEGRRNEFARFERFRDLAVRQSIPDPNDTATFQAAKLDWESLLEPGHEAWRTLYRNLLALRQREIVPRLAGMGGAAGKFQLIGDKGLKVRWRLGDGAHLVLIANLGEAPLPVRDLDPTAAGISLYSHPEGLAAGLAASRLPAWSVGWFLNIAQV